MKWGGYLNGNYLMRKLNANYYYYFWIINVLIIKKSCMQADLKLWHKNCMRFCLHFLCEKEQKEFHEKRLLTSILLRGKNFITSTMPLNFIVALLNSKQYKLSILFFIELNQNLFSIEFCDFFLYKKKLILYSLSLSNDKK